MFGFSDDFVGQFDNIKENTEKLSNKTLLNSKQRKQKEQEDNKARQEELAKQREKNREEKSQQKAEEDKSKKDLQQQEAKKAEKEKKAAEGKSTPEAIAKHNERFENKRQAKLAELDRPVNKYKENKAIEEENQKKKEEGEAWKKQNQDAFDADYDAREDRIKYGAMTGLTGQDLDDYIADHSAFEVDFDKPEIEYSGFKYFPMKRKVKTVNDGDSTVTQVSVKPVISSEEATEIPSGASQPAAEEQKGTLGEGVVEVTEPDGTTHLEYNKDETFDPYKASDTKSNYGEGTKKNEDGTFAKVEDVLSSYRDAKLNWEQSRKALADAKKGAVGINKENAKSIHELRKQRTSAADTLADADLPDFATDLILNRMIKSGNVNDAVFDDDGKIKKVDKVFGTDVPFGSSKEYREAKKNGVSEEELKAIEERWQNYKNAKTVYDTTHGGMKITAQAKNEIEDAAYADVLDAFKPVFEELPDNAKQYIINYVGPNKKLAHYLQSEARPPVSGTIYDLVQDIIVNGKADNGHRQLFAEEYNKSLENVANKLDVAVKAYLNKQNRFLAQEARAALPDTTPTGQNFRTAVVHKSTNPDARFPYGLSVSGEGPSFSRIGRIEDRDGKKVLAMYPAMRNTVRAGSTDTAGNYHEGSTKDDEWLENMTTAGDVDPFIIELNEGEDVDDLLKQMGNAMESQLSRDTLRYSDKNKAINEAGTKALYKRFIGKSYKSKYDAYQDELKALREALTVAESDKEVQAIQSKIRGVETRFNNDQEDFAKIGLAVSTHPATPYLIVELGDGKGNVKPDTLIGKTLARKEEEAYNSALKAFADQRKIAAKGPKVYKADDPNTKANIVKGKRTVGKNNRGTYGEGSVDWSDTAKTRSAEKRQLEEYTSNKKKKESTDFSKDILKAFGI